MGFKDVRGLLIDALESGRFQHEYRADMESKNLLAVGDVTPEFVVMLLKRCRGNQYRCSPYHFDRGILCHEFTPTLDGEGWYLKAYFFPPTRCSSACTSSRRGSTCTCTARATPPRRSAMPARSG